MPFVFNPLSGKFDMVSDLSGYVPYTGATADVALGAFDLSATDLTLQGKQIIDITDAEAFLIRKNADSGDLFYADTDNMLIYNNGGEVITTDSNVGIAVTKFTGSVTQFVVDCANQKIYSYAEHHFFNHLYAEDDPMFIYDANENECVAFDTVATAVNYASFANAATGNGPEINASGSDDNIDVEVNPKGTGGLLVTGAGTSIFQEGATFNEGSTDSDTRIEGNGDANLVFCDAGNDRVGIGMSNPAQKLDVTGNVKLSGELMGSRMILCFSKASTSADGYLGVAAQVMTATIGYVMPRAGSIVGVGWSGTISAQTTPGDVICYSKIAGTNKLSTTIAVSGTGDYSGYATQARNTAGSTFTAGQLVQAYVDLSTFVGTISIEFATIEVQFDT